MMKNILIFSFICFLFTHSYAQEYYHIIAKSGLNVRETPSLTASKVAKIPFGVVVEKIESTQKVLTIKDEEKEIKGNWVKIKYQNYPYIIYTSTTNEFYKEGYVFDGFIKPMKRKNVKIVMSAITKANFLQLKKECFEEIQLPKKMKDLATIKAHLKHRVTWQKWGEEDQEDNADLDEIVVKHFITANNQKLVFDTYNSDVGFSKGNSAYYPEEQILVLEGGHSSDVTFSIRNGGETQTVGNPEYIESSERTDYRINGYFGGQECVSYFLEKKEKDVYKFYTTLDLFQDFDVCYFKEFYWVGKTEFVFSKNSYDNTSKKEFDEYFKIEIIE